MVFTDVIVESFGKQSRLVAIFAFDETAHIVLPNRKT